MECLDSEFLEYKELQLTDTQTLALRNLKNEENLTLHEKEIILDLQIQLDKILQKMGSCIIRSSRKCPSDVVRKQNNLTKRIFNLLLRDQSIFNLTFDKTLPDRLWINTIFQKMVVTNGFDAINNVIQNSDIFLKGLLVCNPKIIITKFANIDPQLIYRAYIWKKKINAISQRFSLNTPWIAKNKNMIEKLLIEFLGSVLNKLEHSCIVDVGIKYKFNSNQKLENSPCIIIQTHPFIPSVGSCSFDWIADRDILYYGPLTFRTNNEGKFVQLIPSIWKKHYDTYLKWKWFSLLTEIILVCVFILLLIMLFKTYKL